MNKKLPLISLFIMSIISIFYWTLIPNEELYEAQWNAPDATLAITINGEISTTFPTSSAYKTTVVCTNGSGKVLWNGTKWVLTTSNIIKGNIKCNAIFVTAAPAPSGWYDAATSTLIASIRDSNELKAPLTTPGMEVSAHVLDDMQALTVNVESSARTYYITYGTGYKINGTKFNLTGTGVTSETYANSYSSLVGKYLPYDSLVSSGSSTAGTMTTTTDLNSIVYIVNTTLSSYTLKTLSSTKNTTEALLASTQDDYGTSYYFRGAVKKNYVQFANKCWRIVRVTGDGSIKLVLHNDNTSNVSNPCASSNNSTTAAFARYFGSSYTSAFNSKYNDNAYIGFMYGATGASNYTSTHANTNKSTILINLETWYRNNLASYESKLADTIWCNDKSTASGGLGYGTNNTYYAADNRLVSENIPSLKCPNDNNGGKLSKFTVNDTTNGNGNLTYKIGLLTADEIAFAGYVSTIRTYNHSTYLQENTGSNYWWTMSPYSADQDYAFAWTVTSSGGLIGSTVYGGKGVRPSISLVSSTMVSGGSGTSEDPYIVK